MSKSKTTKKVSNGQKSQLDQLTSLNELNTKAHQLFVVLRRFVSSNDKLSKSIDSIFEKQYLKFLGYIPVNYHSKIIQIYDSVVMLIGCIDFNKLSGSLRVILSFDLDFGFSDFDVGAYLNKLIISKCNDDPSKKQLLLSLVDKSKPIVDCIKYLVNNIGELADVCQSFAEVTDTVF